MKRNGHLVLLRIPNLVQTLGIVNVHGISLASLRLFVTVQGSILAAPVSYRVSIATFANCSIQYLEPTSIAGMIVNRRFFAWIPAQEEERIRFVVSVHQIARIQRRGIRVGVGNPSLVKCQRRIELSVLCAKDEMSESGVVWY